jgi:hypothetical protein
MLSEPPRQHSGQRTHPSCDLTRTGVNLAHAFASPNRESQMDDGHCALNYCVRLDSHSMKKVEGDVRPRKGQSDRGQHMLSKKPGLHSGQRTMFAL